MSAPSGSLDAVLDRALGGEGAAASAGWRRLGFLRNPFPSRAHPVWDVFHNQAEVRDRFYADLGEFIRESNTLTMFFTGGNRVGKTHFMEYHRRTLTEKFAQKGTVVPIAVASAQSCDFWQFYVQVIEQLDDSHRIQTGAGLFEQGVAPDVVPLLDALPAGDFRRAIQTIAAGKSDGPLLMRRWIRGERLRAPQRRDLNVSGLLDSPAEWLNAFEGLVKYLLLPQSADSVGSPMSSRRSPGALVFVDEFELVWQHRRDRRDQFLRSLRALLDACPKGLFFCVGMATGLGIDLQAVEYAYPALFARLKGAREVPTLVQIGGVIEAVAYTHALEDHGRGEFLKQGGSRGTAASARLISDLEVQQLFKNVASGPGATASQGDFFDLLHIEAEKKLAAAGG